MRRKVCNTPILALLAFSLIAPLQCLAQIRLEADGTGKTYELIERQFGRNCYEVPDCGHGEFGRHITEEFDPELKRHVLVFHLHASADDDRCRIFDRQRNEIKGASPSPSGLQHHKGERVYARWKFKLDKDFVPSSRFTHLMQIKPFDGDADLPIITLTARAGNPEKMEVNHSSGKGTGSLGKLASVDLAGFKNNWVEVVMEFVNEEGSAGSFSIEITQVLTGEKLLILKKDQIDLWREGTTFNRLKWGMYRGLHEVLRDEQIRFADFCISEGTDGCAQSSSENPDPVLNIPFAEEERHSFLMYPVFPNPSSSVFHVRYQINRAAPVRLVMANVAGGIGTTIIDRFHREGEYVCTVDTAAFAPGVHLIMMSSGEYTIIDRFVKP